MERKQIANILEEVGRLLELSGENPFKIRAYQQAARTILQLEGDLDQMVADDTLSQVKGIGKALNEKISEMVLTGGLKYLDELKKSFPEGILDLFKISGLGSKKIKLLYEKLGISNLGQLEYACLENRLVPIKGFGQKTQDKILKGIETLKKYRGYYFWSQAETIAESLIELIDSSGLVQQVMASGDFRRAMPVVNNLEVVAASTDSQGLIDFLKGQEQIEQIKKLNTGRFKIVLTSGLKTELAVVLPDQFAITLFNTTGNDTHVSQVKKLAESMGLALTDVGLLKADKQPLILNREEDIYSALGLTFVPPELREGLAELEMSRAGSLPHLVEPEDVKGIFHAHSNFSDGGLSILELVDACRDNGCQYLGLTDHSRTAAYAGGLTLEDLKTQHDKILEIRKTYPDFGLFWGIESDILGDGSLDYPDEVLAKFDFVIASVHSSFNMPEDEMTRRIIKAVENPYTTILGHPTGRLLLAREAYAVDLDAVLEAATKTGTAVEINSSPHRLDLDWRELAKAKSLCIKLFVCPDAHSLEGLGHMRYGINIARKGGLTKDDIVNCLDLAGMEKFIKEKKADAIKKRG